jgi:hypothetical protein
MIRVIVWSAALLAGVAQPIGPALVAQGSQANAVIGMLAGYDARTRMLTVKVDKDVQSFVLAEKASVHLGSRLLPEGELSAQAGRRVKVRFVESGGRRIAQTVMVSRAP